MDWIFLLLAAFSGILFTIGDIFLKFWALKSNYINMVVAIIFYIIAGVVLAYSFKRREIAIAVAVLICFNLITIAIVGFTLFKEVLGLKEIIGISLAIVAIIVLNI